MYLLADGARGVLMQRVNDTHELVKGRVDTIVGPQMMQVCGDLLSCEGW